MLNWFFALDLDIKIQLLSIVVSSLIALLALFISVSMFVQNNKLYFKSNKANIVFMITCNKSYESHTLVIKNFGNSSGTLTSIKLTPPLDYDKSVKSFGSKVLSDSSNVFLAPSQSIKSGFDFEDYPDKVFNVHLEYTTLSKKCIDSYVIDMSYGDSIFYLSPHIADPCSALTHINGTLREFSHKFD